jgi:histidine triad (HIT) family protein
MIDCVFCKIIAREIPAHIIVENDHIIVIKDIAPKATIHYLIIPKKHVKDLSSLHDSTLGAELLVMAQHLASLNSSTQDFRLVVNNGYTAGQRVFHLHVHFLAGSLLPEF